MAVGLEVGEKGTPHLQGYVELNKVMRIAGVKKVLGDRAHVEKRLGTREQARTYCLKDGKYFEKGDFSIGGQGTRNDLKKACELLRTGSSIEEVAKNPELEETYVKYHRGLEKLRNIYEEEETRNFRNVEVQVLVGEAGAGKTRKVMEENNYNVFTVDPTEAFPFDGYAGQNVILIDEFYGNIQYSKMLRILDGYQFRVNIKGGYRYAKWTKIYITSNQEPEQWYTMGLTAALKRRITNVTKFV